MALKKKSVRDFIQAAVPEKNKGLLRKKLGVKEGENIPKEEIAKKIAGLRKRAAGEKKLPAAKLKLLRELLFARTVGKLRPKKKRSLMK